jgi:hypothetical protein
LRVDLPNGQWAELRDPESITNKERYQFQKKRIPQLIDAAARESRQSAMDVGEAEIATQAAEAIMVDMLTGWSFDLPLPKDRPDVFEDDAFDFACYDNLISACEPLVAALKGRTFAPTFKDGQPLREGPTETSSD